MLFSCWWWWMDWLESGNTAEPTKHATINTTIRDKFISSNVEMSATACNEAQQHCVDLVHRNLRHLKCRWWNGSTDSGYIMQDIHLDKSQGKGKPGLMCRTRSVNPRSPVSVPWNREGRYKLQDCHNFSCGKVHWFVLGYYDTFIGMRGRAHAGALQPS